MKLNSKIFVLAVFALVAVVESHAAGVFAYGCAETADEYGQDGMGPLVCDIGQYPSAADAEAAGLYFSYGTWLEFVEGLNAELSWDGSLGMNASGLEMNLVTDLDMGGFTVSGGDTTCVNEFTPIDFSGQVFKNNLSIFDGGNHTIRNFCHIALEEDAGFIKNISGATVHDLNFDSVYVKAGYDSYLRNAAALIGTVNGYNSFRQISVTNAIVQATSRAGGIAGSYTSYGYVVPAQNVSVNATLRAPIVGGVFGIAEYSGNSVDTVLISQAYVDIDVGGNGAVNFTAGGLVGMLNVTGTSFASSGNTINIVSSGETGSVTAGGIVGEVSYGEASQTLAFNNLNNTVDMFVTTTGVTAYAGGIAGSASLSGVRVLDSLNNIRAVISAKGSGTDTGFVAVGGEFGSAQNAESMRFANETVDARLVAAGSQVQRLGGVVGIAKMAAAGETRIVQCDVEASIASTGTGKNDVAMGGLVAHVTEVLLDDINRHQGTTLYSDTNRVTASLEVASSGEICAGGLVGYLKTEDGSSSPSGGFRSSASLVKAITDKDIINVSSKNASALYAGGVAGKIYSPLGGNELLQTQVEGDIDIATESFSDSSAVGGLYGEMLSYRAGVHDNISIGDILSNAPNTGFVIGKFWAKEKYSYFGGFDSDGLKFVTNVHYGSKDAKVKDAVGSVGYLDMTFDDAGKAVDSVYISVDNWSENASSDSFNAKVMDNYRNAVKSGSVVLEPTGSLDKAGSGFIIVKVPVYGPNDEFIFFRDESVWNGVLDDSTMRSRLFVYSLSEKGNISMDDRSGLDSLVSWENMDNSLPWPCNRDYERSAYKVELDVTELYSKLTDADKESLEGILDSLYFPEDDYTEYRLVTYTEKDRRVSPDFVKRIRALSVDFGVTQEGYEVNLETATMSSNEFFDTDENYKFVVVYEMEGLAVDQPAAEYFDLDETLLYPVYLWPKVTEVRRYNERTAIPPVFVMSEYSNQEYYVKSYYVKCRAGEACETSEISDRFNRDVQSFAKLMEDIASRYGPEYSDTVHLVYAQMTADNQVTPILTVGGDRYSTVKLYGYGYKGGERALFDSSFVGGSGLANLPMASRYSAAADLGFVLKKWTADFWAYTQVDAFTLESCYDESNPSEFCSSIETFETDGDYFAGSTAMQEVLEKQSGSSMLLKWSLELDADAEIVMDSVVRAIANFSGESHDFMYSYHLHVNPVIEAIQYAISFDVNAGDFPVFVAGYTDSLKTYSRETFETAMLPELYSIGACFVGWGDRAEQPTHTVTELNEYILGAVSPVKDAFSLYGNWMTAANSDKEGAVEQECSGTREIPLQYAGDNGPEAGEVYLWQMLVNPQDSLKFRHDFENSVLTVPDVETTLRFHVGSEPEPGYVLSRAMLVRASQDDAENDTLVADVLHGEDVIELTPGWDSQTLYALFEKYISVALDLNTKQEDVFYDLDFVQGDSLKVLNNDDQVRLPAWIYTANSCVLGWSAEKDAEIHTYRAMTWSSELYEKLQDTQKLYAVWGDAEQCVESARYARVKAVAENGRIELLEGEGEPRVHRFGTDGSIILPPEQYTGGFRVRAIPDDGYVLEKILLIQDGDTIPFENGEWLEGLVDGAEIRAYFIESAEPVVTDGAKFYQSGNAVRFTFHKEGFVKDGEVSIRISLENDDGKELDGHEYRCVTDACDLEWERFPLAAGFYLFTASVVRDGRDSLLLERDFEVFDEIEIAGEKSWQMLSLANVDMDKLSWDGDETFYWWAEDRNYGKYWQYQELQKSQTPEKERGYWYSSIEGRPLVLKDSAFVDDIAWNLTNENGGWNLVANPYGWYLNLGVDEYDSDEPEEESEIGRKKKIPVVEYSRWNPEEGQYVPVSVLKPYEAVWAKLNRSLSETVEITAKPEFDKVESANGNTDMTRSLNRMLAKAGDGAGFSLLAVLSDGRGKKDSWNVLGVGAAALQSEEPPAGMGDHVNLSILEGGKRLMKSVKAAGEDASYEWNIDLTATSARTGFLSLAGIDGLESRGLSVYVTVDGITMRMQEGEPLKVALSPEAKVATVFVGSAPKVALVKTLNGLKAVQAGATLQVAFDAGAGLAGSAVRVDVLDLKGNVVRSVASKALAGVNHVTLDTPKPGIYMLRVRAGGLAKAGRIMVK